MRRRRMAPSLLERESTRLRVVRWLIVLALALAQTPQASSSATIDVTVVGRTAASVANLTAADFEVEAGGRVQAVRAVEPRPAAETTAMAGAVGPVFDAAPMPPSAAYRLSIDILTGTKPDAGINVRIKRADLSVLSARRATTAPSPESKPPPAATGSIEDRLRDAVARGRTSSAIPLAVGRTIRRAPDASQVAVDLILEIPAATAGPVAALIGIVDTRGAIRSVNRTLDADKGGGPYHFDASLPLSPGRYTLRIAAADTNGAIGAVEVPLNAQLTPVGTLTASDLLRFAADGGGHRRAITDDTMPASAVTLLLGLELYAGAEGPPTDLLVNMSITPEGGNTATSERIVTPELRDGALVAEAEFGVQRLSPGRYTARATVLSGARPLGTLEAVVKR